VERGGQCSGRVLCDWNVAKASVEQKLNKVFFHCQCLDVTCSAGVQTRSTSQALVLPVGKQANAIPCLIYSDLHLFTCSQIKPIPAGTLATTLHLYEPHIKTHSSLRPRRYSTSLRPLSSSAPNKLRTLLTPYTADLLLTPTSMPFQLRPDVVDEF
jgi:hypothetical protein